MLSLINVRQLHRDLYRAENLSDALRIIFLSGPRWLPWVGAGMFFTAYMTFLRVRILISRFRRAARARAERKFFALGLPCDCVTPPPCTLFTKIGDGNDEDDGIVSLEKNDATVTLADIEEFCFVLGLRDSRDDDLFTIVTKMLLVDDIPEGWALYRKSTGELRFLNFSTQELSFFHPGKRKEELYIRKELRRRNRLVMEGGLSVMYSSDSDEYDDRDGGVSNYLHGRCCVSGMCNLVSDTVDKATAVIGRDGASARGSCRGGGATDSVSRHFGDVVDGEESFEQRLFTHLFHYFLECERQKVERETVLKYRSASGSGSVSRGGSMCGAVV